MESVLIENITAPSPVCVLGMIESVDRAAGVITFRGGDQHLVGALPGFTVSGGLAEPHLRRRPGVWMAAVAAMDGGSVAAWLADPAWLGGKVQYDWLARALRRLRMRCGEFPMPAVIRRPTARGGTLVRIYGRRDENGRKLCCLEDCGKPVPKGRRDWCSQACVDRFRADADWAGIRDAVMARDHNTCRLCGYVLSRAVPFRERRRMEVDHIVRVADGGTNDLSNLRLLCRPCHAKVTREQAFRVVC